MKRRRFLVEYGFDAVCRFVRATNAIRRCRAGGASDEGEWSRFEDNAKVRSRVATPSAVNQSSVRIPDERTDVSRAVLRAALASTVTNIINVRLQAFGPVIKSGVVERVHLTSGRARHTFVCHGEFAVKQRVLDRWTFIAARKN